MSSQGLTTTEENTLASKENEKEKEEEEKV